MSEMKNSLEELFFNIELRGADGCRTGDLGWFSEGLFPLHLSSLSAQGSSSRPYQSPTSSKSGVTIEYLIPL